jgi:hypothetical protein
MRAKMKIVSVLRQWSSEVLSMAAVSANMYPADGSDENNTFAKWTPNADLHMTITNPELIGKFDPGMEFYVDFSQVRK